MPVIALLTLQAEALLLEVLAYWPLLLDVVVQEGAGVAISAGALKPEGAHLLLVLCLIVAVVDGTMDLKDLLDSFLLQIERAVAHVVRGLL